MSADVVGYSRLMGMDEARTLSRLNALRRELIDPAIAGHSGRIVKLMGDGALVEFASAVDVGHINELLAVWRLAATTASFGPLGSRSADSRAVPAPRSMSSSTRSCILMRSSRSTLFPDRSMSHREHS
jgi:class 3 adenylate cyclase